MIAAESKKTVAQEAAELGVSERHVYRIRAKERGAKAEWQRPERERLDPHDYPYMGLDAPGVWPHYASCTSEGQANKDYGTYNVGGQVRSIRGGRIADDADLTDDRTNATSYQPDPDGLKGGVG
jgi:hypothetical protein